MTVTEYCVITQQIVCNNAPKMILFLIFLIKFGLIPIILEKNGLKYAL